MTEEVNQENTEEGKEEGTQVQTPELSPLEQQAANYGWMPKEKWIEAGHDEGDWAPAKHFMKVGELKKQVIEKEKALNKQEKLIKVMKNHHLNVKQTAYDEALKTLKAEREVALEENDLIKAERIKDKIEETKERAAKDRALPADVQQLEQEQAQPQQSIPPEFFEFQERNPWYRTDGSDEMSREADKIGVAEAFFLRNNNKEVNPAEVYKVVEQKIRKLYPEKFQTQTKSPQSSGSKQTDRGRPSGTKLTEEELAVAKSFGMTPEKYAAEMKGYKGR